MKYLIVDMYLKQEKHEEFLHKLLVEEYDVCIFFSPSECEYWFEIEIEPGASSISEIRSKIIWPKALKIIKQRNKKIDVITGAYKVLSGEPIDPDIRVHRWDTYWITEASKRYITNSVTNSVINNYSYHYVYLNNNAHHHRQQLIDLVAKHNLLKYGAVSWHSGGINGLYDFKYFNPVKMTLTDSFDRIKPNEHFFKLPIEYGHSFAQLISETSVSSIFVTEKTVISLLLGKPFLVATAPGFHRYLRDLGFELYTEIFNYSFDSEPDQEKRFVMVLENFERLCSLSLEELPNLYKKIESKIEYNKQHAKQVNNRPSILNDLPERLWYGDDWLYNKYMFKTV
jgi:hypothetical protein